MNAHCVPRSCILQHFISNEVVVYSVFLDEDDSKLMHIWSLSFCLALIFYTRGVCSKRCQDDLDCDNGRVCCGICAPRSFCGRSCSSDGDCSYANVCKSGSCVTPTFIPPTYPDFNVPTFRIPTFRQFTYEPPDYNSCVWDSDCYGNSFCESGECVDDTNDGAFSWSGSKVIGIVFFVAIATVISCLYHMCKRSRKPPQLPTQNAPPTGVAREATSTIHVTEHELQPGNNGVVNGATVIGVEEVNEDSPPLPRGAPPPYSSLDFERQQRNENGDPEQPPPTYDEAVKNSAMALV